MAETVSPADRKSAITFILCMGLVTLLAAGAPIGCSTVTPAVSFAKSSAHAPGNAPGIVVHTIIVPTITVTLANMLTPQLCKWTPAI